MPERPLLVKVDVEGHETSALRGLAHTIEARRPVILAELNDYMLSTNGSSSAELLSLLRDWGYRAYRLRVWRTAVRRRPRVELHDPPPDWPGERTVNIALLSTRCPPPPHIARLIRA